MLSDEQRANITEFFHALDVTDDGLITSDDTVVLADQVCTALALDAESAAHREIQAAYRQLWDELMRVADADADGAVSLEEFLDAMDRGMLEDPEFVDRAMLVVTHAFFTAVDADGDERIDIDEFTRAMTVTDPSKDEVARAGFGFIDQDGDGAISRAELIAAIRAVFTSSELPDVPGSRMVR